MFSTLDFFFLLFLLTAFGRITAESACGVLGQYSGVVCITETSYKLSTSTSEVHQCLQGEVCADHPSICISEGEPVCRFAKFCGICMEGGSTTCMSRKTYALCDNGEVGASIRNCQASKPYCSMPFDSNGVPQTTCTHLIENAACGDPTPPLDQCTDYGKFPVSSDSTCKRYYFCYHQSGTIARAEFICPNDTLYHPVRGKCVKGGDFECNTL